MMDEKITAKHLKRLAIVYVRQSSPGQVRNNVESYRVQLSLKQRAIELGWDEARIRIIQHDQGKSATRPGMRSGFDEMLQLVRAGEAGIVFASEVSRWARNNLESNLLVHYCAVLGAVLGDESNVWDPTLPEDSLVLGIQSAVAAHESSAIRRRMERGLQEKASRGELHHGVPPGYVYVEGKHLQKHPDARVQRAVQLVFDLFEQSTSVYDLTRQLWQQGVKLPAPGRADDSTSVSWIDPSYKRLLDMLENPKYAGIYAYPLKRVVIETQADGTARKRVRKVARGQWDVELRNHHPAYISVACYERNQEKIAMNANRFAPQARGAPLSGEALLAGLIRCRGCNHQMHVSYRSSGAITYACQRGRRQRDAVKDRCFQFRANELEDQLVEHLLQAVRPAGIEASLRAAQQMAAQRAGQRRLLEDALEHAYYQADLTRRRFDKIDPSNRLVFDTLAEELEASLQQVEQQKAKLAAFDRDEPPRPTPQEQSLLSELGTRLEQVWFNEQADGRVKKQIVRTLIDHVYAELDDQSDEVVLYVQWSAGHVTELRHRRRSRKPRSTAIQLQAVIDSLRHVVDDEAIARILNRSRLRTEQDKTWTRRRVSSFRKRHGIVAFDPAEKEKQGWLSQSEAATRLGISPMSLHRLIQSGILTPKQYFPGLPTVLSRTELETASVQRAVKKIRSHGTAPLPSDPKQLSLFTTTKSQKGAS
jgi:DNA invertase Pin-like site-specific DNA recombinase